jgi:hypothetical protein
MREKPSWQSRTAKPMSLIKHSMKMFVGDGALGGRDSKDEEQLL